MALYTVALESAWFLVAVAVGHPRGRRRHGHRALDAHRQRRQVASSSSPGWPSRRSWPASWCGALRRQLDWLAERAQRLEIERDQQASLAAAAERARIAREMHDVVSHNIQVMVTLADAAAAAQALGPRARRRGDARRSRRTGRQALTDMRRMLGVLREEPASVGLSAAAGTGRTARVTGAGQRPPRSRRSPACATSTRWSSGCAAPAWPCRVERAGRPFDLSGAAGLTVYRIVQEALTNALEARGRTGRSVEVCLDFDDPDVSVRVTDDGRRCRSSRCR